MVSYEQYNDAVDVVRRGMNDQRTDEQTLASAMILAERLGQVNRLGGLFGQVSLSPQMDALMARQPAGAVEVAV